VPGLAANPVQRGEFVQCRTRGLADTFKPVETAHSRQHVRRVGALATFGLHQAPVAQALQESVEQLSFGATFDQARAELTEDRVVEAGIDQRQTQCVFPVDPSAYGIRSLSIGQALHELQHRRQSEPPGASACLPRRGNRAENWSSV
jgi:hypothetical protein